MLPFSTADWRRRFEQQANWTRNLRQYLLPRAGLKAGSRILEVGCGPGVILDEIDQQILDQHGRDQMPGLFLSQSLFGLDIRLDYLHYYASVNPVSLLGQGDAHNLPYMDYAFDLVLCHYLLLWVSDPLLVVSEMERVCRNGGSVLALAEPDYGGRIDYPPELEELGVRQRQALIMQGADPDMGRKLGGFFSQAGLKEIETGVLGGQWRGALADDDWELEWQVLANDLGEFVTMEELKVLKEADYQAYQSNHRTLFVPTFYAWGKKIEKNSK